MPTSNLSPPQARSRFVVHGCKMHRRNADRLWRAMQEGFPENSKITLSTERSITTLEAGSLDDLAEAVAVSTEPGNPEILDNLTMSVQHYESTSSAYKQVRISVTDSRRVHCTVIGEPSWVRGKTAALQPLVEEMRPFKSSFWYGPTWTFASWGLSAALFVSGTPLAFVSDEILSLPARLFIHAAFCVIGVIAGSVFGRVVSRKTAVEIWLKRDEFPQSWWRLSANEVLAAIIALLALIATVIFGVVAHGDATDASRAAEGHSTFAVPISAVGGTALGWSCHGARDRGPVSLPRLGQH